MINRKAREIAKSRANGFCEVCGRSGPLELHHIIRRKVPEDEYNIIYLCPDCHRGTNGIHGKNGHKLDLKLKLYLQRMYFILGFSEKEVREKMGARLYEQED